MYCFGPFGVGIDGVPCDPLPYWKWKLCYLHQLLLLFSLMLVRIFAFEALISGFAKLIKWSLTCLGFALFFFYTGRWWCCTNSLAWLDLLAGFQGPIAQIFASIFFSSYCWHIIWMTIPRFRCWVGRVHEIFNLNFVIHFPQLYTASSDYQILVDEKRGAHTQNKCSSWCLILSPYICQMVMILYLFLETHNPTLLTDMNHIGWDPNNCAMEWCWMLGRFSWEIYWV